MMKYLRHMMVFNAVVEAGSISSAAEQLNISKSVVSQQLQTLESVLKVELLKRTTRRQVLTPAGKQFFLQCQQIDQISKHAWSDARDSQQLPIGTVSISAPHALMDTVVAPAIGALVSQYPKITPYLHADDARVHLIDDNIDIAIRIGQSADSEFKQKRVGQFSDQLCVNERYLSQHSDLTLSDIQAAPSLANHLDYIANGWQGALIEHQLFNTKQQKSHSLQFKPNRFANSINGVLALALQGAGVALIPQLILNQLTNEHRQALAIITTEHHLQSEPIYALHAFSQTPPFIVKLCVEAIEQRIQTVLLS